MKKLLFSLIAFSSAAALGCAGIEATFSDIPEEDFLKESTAPLVQDVGTLTINPAANAAEGFAEVGRPNKGIGDRGGITGLFQGTGDAVCVVLDPQGRDGDLDTADDGDSDLVVGLEANYTGTPGVKLGSFESVYTDPLGVEHVDDANLCVVEYTDSFGRLGAHMGKGVVEFCVIDTVAGNNYLVVGETFNVPADDANLIVTMAVVETVDQGAGPVCPTINEQTLVEDREL